MPQEQATRKQTKEVKTPGKTAPKGTAPKAKTELSAMLRFVIDVHISNAEIQSVEVCTPENVCLTFYGAEQKTPILNVLADIERVAQVVRQAEIRHLGKPYVKTPPPQTAKAQSAKAQSAKRGAK